MDEIKITFEFKTPIDAGVFCDLYNIVASRDPDVDACRDAYGALSFVCNSYQDVLGWYRENPKEYDEAIKYLRQLADMMEDQKRYQTQ